MRLEDDPLPGVRGAALFRIRDPRVFEAFRRAPDTAYEVRVFTAAAELTDLFEELEHVIGLIPRAITFQELTAVLKLYIISWVSLSDVLGSLLNEAYDLGISKQDVEFGAILRNTHIAATAIPQIVRNHSRTLRYDEFATLRNNIVHRGRLEEKDLVSIHTEFLMNILNRVGTLSIDDEAGKAVAVTAARNETRVEERIRDLMNKKNAEYTAHLETTLAFLRDVAPVLVHRIESHGRVPSNER